MNFSADNAARKWSCGWHASGKGAMPVIAAVMLVLGTTWPIQVGAVVPLPRPRPAEAPKTDPAPDQAGPATPDAPEPAPPQSATTADPRAPEPSACRRALVESIAIAPSIPSIRGPGECGGEDLVRLEAVVISPAQRVALKPPAVLRCTMATAVADWIRNDMVPLAAGLGTTISELDNFDSFSCRGRNRVNGAKLSEHGRANALDVRGLKLANGNTLSLTDRTLLRETREKVLTTVCTRFTTVLGPGSDWYHEDHIHLDLADRRNNYKLCQWGVYDPLPAVAPLMPAERPDEAPPRQTAEEKAGQEKAAAPPGAASPESNETPKLSPAAKRARKTSR